MYEDVPTYVRMFICRCTYMYVKCICEPFPLLFSICTRTIFGCHKWSPVRISISTQSAVCLFLMKLPYYMHYMHSISSTTTPSDYLTIRAWKSAGLMASTDSLLTSTILSPTFSRPCRWMIPSNRMRAMIKWLFTSFKVIPCR